MADRKQLEILYQSIARDLQKVKAELLNEVKYSSAQVGALCNTMGADKNGMNAAVAQEIRYGYKQNQNIYQGISDLVQNDVGGKLKALDEKLSALEQLKAILEELGELRYNYIQMQTIYEGLSSSVAEEVIPKVDEVAAKTGEIIDVHTRKIVDAITNAPAPEKIDYVRISDEVGDKLIEVLNALRAEIKPLVIDYDRIINSTVEQVIASMPYPEKTDINALASAVASKIVVPVPVVSVPEVDYERLADLVMEKMSAKEQKCDVMLDENGLNAIAERVAEKLSSSVVVDYDRIGQLAQEAQIKPEAVDYNLIGDIVEAKLAVEEESEETTFDLVLDEDGVNAIAKGVAEELRGLCTCQCEEAPKAEEPAPEAASDTADDELAVAVAPALEVAPMPVIEPEEGMVIRYKKSFTAKMKQSKEPIKEYYSAIKNALNSYKKINSNVSWQGDRFNFGRETVAKINVIGSALCLYVALDPADPEFKPTVYNQKDVAAQSAYKSTPFMVKIKSNLMAKKALRLIEALAEKFGAEKDAGFKAVDYVEEYPDATDEQLLAEGQIKIVQEKKVDFNF